MFDSLSEMRLLARDSLRYRRQILALKHYFTGRACTVLLLDYGLQPGEFQLQSLTHGVLSMERETPELRRRAPPAARCRRSAASRTASGFHDYVIQTGGLQVFPRLVAARASTRSSCARRSRAASPELDTLLGGGLDRGTSTMLLGPSGVGQVDPGGPVRLGGGGAAANAPCVYSFDESPDSWIERAQTARHGLREHEQAGLVGVRQVDPAELSPGRARRRMCAADVEQGVRLVVHRQPQRVPATRWPRSST